MRKDFMFTSESVTAGHPDKLCDQISDAIVDHFLRQDPYARVRAECAVSSAIVFIAAIFATSAKVDITHVARKVIKLVGYDQPDFNSKTCSILTAPKGFPPDKSGMFDENKLTDKEIEKISVDSQATVFGFACDHTADFMPFPIWVARKVSSQLTTARIDGTLPYLMPDAKVQVGVEFRQRKPKRIHSITVTASQKNLRRPNLKRLRDDIREAVLTPVFEDEDLKPDSKTRIFINHDGIFLGGPTSHSGLTGRKNAVDTYGGFSRHSGHALSGKDPLRIDRLGPYMARYVAKNIVASGLAGECEVTLSYSVGFTKPVSIQIETFDSGKISNSEISERVIRHFDFRPAGILKQLGLRVLPMKYPMGFYQQLAASGHFGRDDLELPWEKLDKMELIA